MIPPSCRPELPRSARLIVLLLLIPAAVQATPNFPPTLQRELALATEPTCALCHQGTPQVGTVITPFGTAMRERGLVFHDEDALRTALVAMAEQQVDSDGDGVTDLDELREGSDPNVAPPVGPTPEIFTLEDPRYGCASSGTGLLGGPWLLVLGCILARRVRTRLGTAQRTVHSALGGRSPRGT